MIYLVIEYENNHVYIPFKNIECIDYFTVAFDNLLDLGSSLNKILDIGIPNKEIIDVYMSEDISLIMDDNQEYNKRYLAIKYSKDNFIKEDVRNKFAIYLTESIKRIDKHAGLHQVFMNYVKKYHKENKLTSKDIYNIATLYLKDNYLRYKDFYFRFKDKGYKFKINKTDIKYNKKTMKQIDKDNEMLLVMFTGYSIRELKEYIQNELKSGYTK